MEIAIHYLKKVSKKKALKILFLLFKFMIIYLAQFKEFYLVQILQVGNFLNANLRTKSKNESKHISVKNMRNKHINLDVYIYHNIQIILL